MELELIEEKKKNLQFDKEKMEQLKTELSEKLLKIRDEETSVSNQLNVLRSKVSALEDKKFEIEETNLSMEKGFLETFEKFAEDIKDNKNQLGSIKQMILNKNKELKEKDDLVLEKSTQISEYSGIVKVLKKEKENLEQQIDSLNERKEQLSNSLLLIKENFGSLKIQNVELRAQNEILQIKKNSIEKELTELISKTSIDLEESQKRSDGLTSELLEKEKILSELNQQIEEKRDELTLFQDDMHKAELQREEYSTKISQLIAIEKGFQEKIENYKAKIEEFENKIVQENINKEESQSDGHAE